MCWLYLDGSLPVRGDEFKRENNMKKLMLAIAATLALCACESTTPAERYTQAQQLVAQTYGNKLSPTQQAALATAIYQQAEATRAIQQAQSTAIIAQGFQQAGAIIGQQQPIPQFNYQPLNSPVFNPVPITPIPVQITHY
jgi:hypothetical protein